MKLTVLRAAVVALILLKVGKVDNFQNISVWVIITLVLLDFFYIWLRHLVITLGLIRKYENKIYEHEVDRIKSKAIRNLQKSVDKNGR